MKNFRTSILVSGVMAVLLSTASVGFAQQRFATPEAASDALAAAARSGDRKTLVTILGPGSQEILSSGDPVADEQARKDFIEAYDAGHRVDNQSGKATIIVGRDDYPLPIPIVQKDGSWKFDAIAGREEILARRIGRNELAAMQVCLAYFDAQNDYAAATAKVDGSSVYAQRVVSQPGKKDGLYWPAAQGEPASPLGEAVADATQQGYRVGSQQPYHGYYYRILTRQGSAAPGGALDYVVDGKMIGGFALVAYPAEYGNSGITTFLVSHNGVVLEKDLGPATKQIASGITAFNPDPTWKPVTELSDKK